MLELAKLLLTKGVDVDEKVEDSTALSMAADTGNIMFVKFLVENGAKINAKVCKDIDISAPPTAACVLSAGGPTCHAK